MLMVGDKDYTFRRRNWEKIKIAMRGNLKSCVQGTRSEGYGNRIIKNNEKDIFYFYYSSQSHFLSLSLSFSLTHTQS